MSIAKMNKEEKLEHRRVKKELKEKISEQDRSRTQLMTQPPVPFQFLRVGSEAQTKDGLFFVTPFTAKHIYIAKKCIANRLSKPPNCDLPEIRDDNKSATQSAINKGDDSSFLAHSLDEFNIPNCVEPLKRT